MLTRVLQGLFLVCVCLGIVQMLGDEVVGQVRGGGGQPKCDNKCRERIEFRLCVALGQQCIQLEQKDCLLCSGTVTGRCKPAGDTTALSTCNPTSLTTGGNYYDQCTNVCDECNDPNVRHVEAEEPNGNPTFFTTPRYLCS